MENENVQQPTYEQLMQAYMNMVRENQQLRSSLQIMQEDKLLERLQLLMRIIENRNKYQTEIVKYAEGYVLQMLKPTVKETEETK